MMITQEWVAMYRLIYQSDNCMIFHCHNRNADEFESSQKESIKIVMKDNFILYKLVAEIIIDENNVYLIYHT
jgi:hypothetical protein